MMLWTFLNVVIHFLTNKNKNMDIFEITMIEFYGGSEDGFRKGFYQGHKCARRRLTRQVTGNLLKETDLSTEKIAAVTGSPLSFVEKMKSALATTEADAATAATATTAASATTTATTASTATLN